MTHFQLGQNEAAKEIKRHARIYCGTKLGMLPNGPTVNALDNYRVNYSLPAGIDGKTKGMAFRMGYETEIANYKSNFK